MIMDFKIPTKDKKEETPKGYSNKDIETWLEDGKTVKSTTAVMICGDPKTCKTAIAMHHLSKEDLDSGKKHIYIEMNSDMGGRICKKEFHEDHPNIIVIDPKVIDCDLETGDYRVDYKKTMNKIRALLKWIDENKDEKNIAVCTIDGVDRFLSDVCEGQLRVEKNLDAAGGVTYAYWKIRNQYFNEIMNQFLSLDLDRICITHWKKDNETGEKNYGCQKDFPDKISQIVITRQDGNKFYAKMISDRRKINPETFNKEVLVMEVTDKGSEWKGYKI